MYVARLKNTMKKFLIINDKLSIGGAEKLVFELIQFSKQNNIEAKIVIIDNYNTEHYDALFIKMHVEIARVRLKSIKHFRKPIKMLTSLLWLIKLKYLSNFLYSSIHIIGLYNAEKVIGLIKHKHRFFWNVNNAAQFENQIYPVNDSIFHDTADTIININKYQKKELIAQYGNQSIKAKMIDFKLFISNDNN